MAHFLSTFQYSHVRRKTGEPMEPERVEFRRKYQTEAIMSFGKGALLWLIGIPLPIILLTAVFMHH
jgi:hypothetical protein